MELTLVNFYKFYQVIDPRAAAAAWKSRAAELGLKGTLIFASEGVNGAVWGEKTRLSQFLQFAEGQAGAFRARFTPMEEPPFRRLVAKVRREIVTFGPDVDQRLNQGRFLSPEQVHELAQSGRAVFLDTRNTYESAVGTFEGAVTPSMESFREFAQVVEDLSDRKQETIVAFCTGGIRCEKAVPYMVEKGFSNVFQIDGGILAYLEKYPDGAFKGDCFVFDDRYTITQDGAKGAWTPCPRCGEPEKDGICVICGTAARPARR